MAAKKKNDATNDSSALSELKDTIKSQAAEINRLRAELAKKDSGVVKKVPSGGGHGHHGGGGSDKEDILNYKNKSFVSIATERVPWLALFLISLSFTAIIMNGFEHRSIKIIIYCILIIFYFVYYIEISSRTTRINRFVSHHIMHYLLQLF